jgi:hypothetical protein
VAVAVAAALAVGDGSARASPGWNGYAFQSRCGVGVLVPLTPCAEGAHRAKIASVSAGQRVSARTFRSSLYPELGRQGTGMGASAIRRYFTLLACMIGVSPIDSCDAATVNL